MRKAVNKVLLLDHEPQSRRLVVAGLERFGYSVTEAENGTAGLSIGLVLQPDLVILDPASSDLNRDEVLEAIRSWSNVPVIILSAQSEEEYKVRFLQSGADDYMTKPFGIAELAARMLACNARFLDDTRTNVIKSWLGMNSVENRTMYDIHEALGCAGFVWTLAPEQLEILVTRLSPASRFPPRTANYRGETVISSSGDEAATALGKIGQKIKLDPEVSDRLANIAAARTDLNSRDAVLSGLAFQRYGGVQDAGLIYARLSSTKSDAVQRELEIEVGAAVLRGAERAQADAVAAELLRLWRAETEPELRMSIARVLGEAGRTPSAK